MALRRLTGLGLAAVFLGAVVFAVAPARAEEPFCFECHDDFPGKMKAFALKHDPAAGGECTACHLDHKDEEKLMLVKEGAALCYIRVLLKVQAYQFGGKGDDHTLIDRLTGLGLVGQFGNDWLKIGSVKIICDGAIMANTGALREPYDSDPETRGVINYRHDQLADLVEKIHRAGFQIEIHAHGDRAIDLTLNAYEKALQ